MSAQWDLVIFTVVPRAHLLVEAYRSFRENCDIEFRSVILSLAGWDEKYWGVINEIKPDILLWDREVKGYYISAVRAIRETAAPYVFWFEDDYTFHRKLPFSDVEAMFMANPNICQVTIPRGEVPKQKKAINELDWMYATVSHFANGDLLRNALENIKPEMISHGNQLIGIEQFLGTAMKMVRPGVQVAQLDNEQGRYLLHIGAMYASSRESVSVFSGGSIADIFQDAPSLEERISEIKTSSRVSEKWREKLLLHSGNIIQFLALGVQATVSYPFSRKMREFVFRTVQYFKHTP